MADTEVRARRSDGGGDKVPLLNRETLVPIGLLVAVVLSSITATVWINTQLLNLIHSVKTTNDRIDLMKDQLTALGRQVENGHSEDWSRADMIRWVELVNAKNPNLNVPIPSK